MHSSTLPALVLVLGTLSSPLSAEPAWPGFYLQGGLGNGPAVSVAAGYRHQLGDTNLYLGTRIAVAELDFTADDTWDRSGIEATTTVSFGRSIMAGADIGYAVGENLLVYLGGGFASLDSSYEQVTRDQDLISIQSETGTATGTYVLLGMQRQLTPEWSFGAEVARYNFDLPDEFLNAERSETYGLSLTVARTF